MSGNVPFSRFQLLEALGQGGMGVVHRAIDTETGAHVAVKIGNAPADATAAERFNREMRHAVAVHHPNVCGVIATGRRDDGALFLVMELIDGPRLLDVARARRASPLLWVEVLRALGQPEESPPLPDWVQAWVAGDAQRVWPPELPQTTRAAVAS